MVSEHKTTIRLPRELHKQAKVKAALQDRTLSDVFRELVERWVKGEIELPTPSPQEKQPGDTG